MRLRQPETSDERAYLGLFLREEVEDWLRPAPLPSFTAVDVREMLGEDIRHWSELGFGPWVLIDGKTELLVGRAGLRRTAVEGEPAVELAWTVDPDRQNEGFATEAATAALDLARSLQLNEVVAMTLPANHASRRVAEKAGMRLDGEVEHAGLAHVLYRLTLA